MYKVDSSYGDVVVQCTITSPHVVPDRKQYDEHTHRADMIPGVVFRIKQLCKQLLLYSKCNCSSKHSTNTSIACDTSSIKVDLNSLYLHTRALSGQHSDPCALSALEPFFGDFSAARPRLVARLAPSDSPQSRGHVPACGSALAAAVAQR